jgi:Tfp pilus assembly protein PilN
MRALRLDYQRNSKPLPWLGLLLLATALLALVLLGGYYQDLKQRNALWEAKVDRIAHLSSRGARAARPLNEQAARAQILEVQQANQVLRQLSLPWNALFNAVEASAGNDVALLALEPDAQKGTVRISGEAKRLDAVLGFVKHLGTHGVFTRVFLQNHQVQEQDPQRPVRFTLQAVWKVAAP